ncbi:MAG: histone deacetylase [Desulfobacterota bacterium]|nr:histone deacetylase [Thermodesulfobacteriota bacterium]MDW8001756.1 histone deacetylase [Deltaproteobacteria bacterium]
MVGLVKDELFLEHKPEAYHPENPKRLEYIYKMLPEIDQDGIFYISARDADPSEITYVHDPSYVNFVAATSGFWRRLDPDTYVSPRSYEVALRAVGATISLIDAVMEGKIRCGFALIRPPGHHAEKKKAMGFCLFNNVAIAARHLQRLYGLNRTAIIDFDLHHGNGTQNCFYRENSVLYISTHQYPYYPGTGWLDEIGEEEGRGYTVNVPLPYGMGDEDYVFVFRDLISPLLRQYKPEFILVSAGFDAYHRDPLGGMSLTEDGYGALTRILNDIARDVCKGRLVFVLEGGYDLQGLCSSVKRVIEELKISRPFGSDTELKPSKRVIEIVAEIKEKLSLYWRL